MRKALSAGRLLLGVSALLLSGCLETKTYYLPPDHPGVFYVGTRWEIATLSTGIETTMQVWFPTSWGVEEPYSYDVFEVMVGSAVPDAWASCGGVPRPVVVFSHGYGGIRFQNFTLAEHLARHGWMVVAPDHILSTAFDMDDELMVSVGMRRPLDVAAAFDWFAEWSEDEMSPVYGCVDPEAGYAVIGHSFGAATTLAVAGAHMDMEYLSETCAATPTAGCQDVDQWIQDHPGETHSDRSDPRAWAAVAISPGFRDVLEDGLPLISIPTMVIGGDGDTITPWDTRIKPMFDALTVSPRFLGQFENSGHFNVTDGCPFLSLLGADQNGCEAGFRPPEEVLPELRTVALAFLRFVNGSEEARDWLPPDYAGFSHWEEW